MGLVLLILVLIFKQIYNYFLLILYYHYYYYCALSVYMNLLTNVDALVRKSTSKYFDPVSDS